jgi:hypothetical protein
MPSRRHHELAPTIVKTDGRFTGSQQTVFAELPQVASELLSIHGSADVNSWGEQGNLGPPRSVRRFVQADNMLEVATDSHGALALRRETRGRQWAISQGVDTATLHGAAADGTWLLGQWLLPLPAQGPCPDWPDWSSYLDAALAVAAAIATAIPPPEGTPAAVWRSPRAKRLTRALRGTLAGIPQRLWWATRTAAAALPAAPIAHGDFYYRNLLWDQPRQRCCAVDWEYLGTGPRYGDLVRFWSVLPRREHRDAWLDRVWSITPAEHHHHIALLALWYALRRIGENVKAPRTYRNPDDTAHAWSVLPEAQELARSYGVYPL